MSDSKPPTREEQVDAIARIFYGIIAANPEIVCEAWDRAIQEYGNDMLTKPEDEK